jgi:DNA-binding Xre family transcriptional regulator
MQIMIRSNFDALRRQKEARENRDLTLRKIAEETQLSTSTLQRVKNPAIGDVTLSTVEKLCRYFGAKKIGDLIEYVPDPE